MARFPRYDGRRDNIRCKQPSCKGVQRGAVFELVEQRILDGLKEITESFIFEKSFKDIEKKEKALEQNEKLLAQKRAHRATLLEQKANLHELLEQKVYNIETFMERSSVVGAKIKEVDAAITDLEVAINTVKENEVKQVDFVPKVKKVIDEYYATNDIKRKNRLLKSILEKATFRREMEWKELDHFVIQLYPLI